MRLLLIRHGQTPSNVLGALDTAHPGAPLTELGLAQAAAIPRALRDEQVDAVFASTLLRTQLTAEPLARHVGVETKVRDGLHEIEAGSLEMRTDRQSQHTYMGTVLSWGAGDLSARFPGGPSGSEFFDRYDAAIERIADEHDGTVAVFSHGAAIRVWVAGRARNISARFAAENHLENTGVVVLNGDPGLGWIAESWTGVPLGGPLLEDVAADDPTGEAV
ncbi:histidine phosphatase family protein [Lysobacter korlensis]|uniref:Histidine phosphatase family protein n=1 Tax=Lysobacter korlensis TaxID=553636 RepID=A0ABV6RXH7_9GAMM